MSGVDEPVEVVDIAAAVRAVMDERPVPLEPVIVLDGWAQSLMELRGWTDDDIRRQMPGVQIVRTHGPGRER